MRSCRAACPALLLAGMASLTSTTYAQKKSVEKTRPAVGTVQMPGDKGKVGTTYQLGPKGDELNFVLEKAEFATRFVAADRVVLADPTKRLLVLSLSVQNPRKQDALFFDQSFNFTIVSPDDQNFAELHGLYHPDRRERLNMQLKPAQKVRALAVVPVYVNGPIAKLIVQRGERTPVLRYELQDKVTPLGNAFAVSGALDAAPIGSAEVAKAFELGPFDITLDKLEDVPAAIGQYSPDAGEKLVVANLTIRNAGMRPQELHYSILEPKLRSEDGDDLTWTYGLLRMSSAEQLNMSIDPGQQVRARMVFKAPVAARANRLIIKEQASGRSVAVAVGGA